MLYHTYLSTSHDKLTGVWDSDMELSNFKDLGEVAKGETDEVALKARWNRQWGADYEEWEYQWLDDIFERYTEEILDMDTAKEMTYRNLCQANLRKFKDPTDKDAGDEILKLMKVLKLDQFKENKQSDTEKFIERMAWNIENTKPCECEDLNKYKDFSGFEPTWKDILRCCRNLVGGGREYPDLPSDQKR